MASVSTRDHAAIRRWAGERGASPARVSATTGLLRFEFDQPPELASMSWDDFFRAFDERGLALVYDDAPASRFHKLVYPEAKPAAPAARPPRIHARAQLLPLPKPGRKRPAARTAAARQAGGSESGRTTSRSSKGGKPAGKTTKKAASQRPSSSRRAA